MTNQARWLAFLSLIGLAAGTIRGQLALTLVSLSVSIWILVEWLRFQARVHIQFRQIRFERLVNGRHESSGTLWAGRIIRVELRVRSRSTIGPILKLHDVLPEILELHANADSRQANSIEHRADSFPKTAQERLMHFWDSLFLNNAPQHAVAANQWISLSPCARADFSYQLMPRAAGFATLPGIRVSLVGPFGFFQLQRFVQLEQTFRILPDFSQSGAMRPTIKRHNTLPKHGVHRLRRSGVSSELLELREYVDGDPPKSIAWKASARRDKLMTRQYESEVPVRIQFFVDGSTATRLGGFGLRLLDQCIYVVASISKAAISVGDPVSGTLIDETKAQRLPWFSGDLGFLQMMNAIAEFSNRPPPTAVRLTRDMLLCARAVCHERYPELLDRRYNSIPFHLLASNREKSRLLSVLAEVFRLSPRLQAECWNDDSRFAFYVQKFLFQAGMSWLSPLLSEDFEFDADPSRCVPWLIESMKSSIARARDNEVFVVLADPQTCCRNLEQLLPVVRLALAKHHRVAFVCPTTTFSRPHSAAILPHSASVKDLLFVAEQARMREMKDELTRAFVRLGAAVTFSGPPGAIQMVLAEIDLVRSGRTRKGALL